MAKNTAVLEAYQKADRDLRLRYSKIACILAIVLVPAGSSLDYFVYPDFLDIFVIARLICSAFLLIALVLFFTNLSRNSVIALTLLCILSVQLTMSFMIFWVDGAQSSYHLGLLLIIFLIGTLLPLSFQEVTLSILVGILLYIIACFGHEKPQIDILFNNVYFMALTGSISSTASFFYSRGRFEEFRLNYELDKRNEEVENTLVQLKEAQTQLVQSEKLRGLGHMAAGLLHEINNPVNYTQMALQLMQQEQVIQDDPDLKETFDDIKDGVGRIQEIISDLRDFATPEQIDQQKPFAFSSALKRALQFTGRDKEGINIRRDICVEDTVMGMQSHIIQVLINLLENAARAVHSVKEIRDPEISITAISEDGRLYVKVCDNGSGIAEDVLPHIFNPFYTTQDVGEGMGLGLSICHTIIDNHGGELRASSSPDQGTEFTFDLSLTDKTTDTAGTGELHHA